MVKTTTKGIFQSDILIRTAIMEGLNELRDNPWLLDYAFAWLQNDTLTLKTYGEKEIADAKDWFRKHEITVTTAYRIDSPQLPSIAIELLESSEAGANSLGDVHYETAEEVSINEIIINPAPILGPFTPKTYNSTTGIVTLPTGFLTTNVFPGNVIFDAVAGKGFVIEDVIDGSSFQVKAGTSANFTKAYIAQLENIWLVSLESVEMQERYRIRCFVSSNPVHLFVLHSILTFILYRRKQDLLEGRGFERSTCAAQGLQTRGGTQDDPEVIYMRDTVISGFVRQYWPKSISQKLDGFIVGGASDSGIKIIGGGESPKGTPIDDQGWGMEFDQFGKR